MVLDKVLQICLYFLLSFVNQKDYNHKYVLHQMAKKIRYSREQKLIKIKLPFHFSMHYKKLLAFHLLQDFHITMKDQT